jgi:hypothetical protein
MFVFIFVQLLPADFEYVLVKKQHARYWRSVYRDSCLTCRMRQNFERCNACNKFHMICLCLYCVDTSR